MIRKSRRLPQRRLRQRGGNQELYDAAKEGDLAQVNILLATPGIDINFRNEDDRFPLFIAASK